MLIIGYGLHIVEVRHLEEFVAGEPLCAEEQWLTATERQAFGWTPRFQYLAGRLAAKTAVWQVLGADPHSSISWLEIEIPRLPTGEPAVVLYGNCQKMATALGITRWLLSISHTPTYAAASAIASGHYLLD